MLVESVLVAPEEDEEDREPLEAEGLDEDEDEDDEVEDEPGSDLVQPASSTAIAKLVTVALTTRRQCSLVVTRRIGATLDSATSYTSQRSRSSTPSRRTTTRASPLWQNNTGGRGTLL